jgi:hypothetical protein
MRWSLLVALLALPLTVLADDAKTDSKTTAAPPAPAACCCGCKVVDGKIVTADGKPCTCCKLVDGKMVCCDGKCAAGCGDSCCADAKGGDGKCCAMADWQSDDTLTHPAPCVHREHPAQGHGLK